MPIRRDFLGTTTAEKSKPLVFQRVSFLQPLLSRLLARAPIFFILIAFLSALASLAQQAPKPPDQNQTLSQHVSDAAKKPVELFNLLDHKSIFFPDIAANTSTLSPGQKFQLFVDNSISVHTFLWSALSSASAQAVDSPTGFEQGWDAYGKRFGASLARESSGEFFGTFMLASALHQDPRFFPQRNPGFRRGVKYSLRRLFVTRSDDGRSVANVSGLLGPLMGEGLANVYWPDRNRTVGDTLFRYGVDLATRIGGNLMREYWPLLYRKMGPSSPAGALP